MFLASALIFILLFSYTDGKLLQTSTKRQSFLQKVFQHHQSLTGQEILTSIELEKSSPSYKAWKTLIDHSDKPMKAHMACSPYEDTHIIQEYFSIEHISHGIIYHSYHDQLTCYRLHIQAKQYAQLIEEGNYQFSFYFLEPVSFLMKLDPVFHSLLQDISSSNEEKSLLTKTFDEQSTIDLTLFYDAAIETQENMNYQTYFQQKINTYLQSNQSYNQYQNNLYHILGDLHAHLSSKNKFKPKGGISLTEKIPKFHHEIKDTFYQKHAYWSTLLDQLANQPINNLHLQCKYADIQYRIYPRKKMLHIHFPSSIKSQFYDANTIGKTCLYYYLSQLIHFPEMIKISFVLQPQPHNNYARSIIEANNRDQTFPYSQTGLNGTGQIIGMADTGLDQKSCYFYDSVNGITADSNGTFPTRRKVIQYFSELTSTTPNNQHGTWMAGTITGYCSNTTKYSLANEYQGVASGSKIAFYDIQSEKTTNTLLIFDLGYDLFPYSYGAGAKIHSDSWGSLGSYSYQSFTADDFLYNSDDFVAVFSAGNDGQTGFYTISNPGNSKNVITVGASQSGHINGDSIESVAPFSSLGPTNDGRIKPDIVAPGTSLISANGVNTGAQTCASSTLTTGTSGAAAVVAGTAALIRQYFVDKRFWAVYCNSRYSLCTSGAFSPSGYLVKSLILHSGRSMSHRVVNSSYSMDLSSQTIPNVYEGYGRLSLPSILPMVSSSQADFDLYIDQSTALGSYTEMTYTVTITSSSTPLKITMAYYDPGNDYFAGRLLNNDLDLVVIDPNNQVYYGNSLSGSLRDEFNPNEQITISSPIVGQYTIKVQAKLLMSSLITQKYAIVITSKGYVSSKSTSAAALTDKASLSRCTYNVQDEITVERLSLVGNNGWAKKDSYQITSTTSNSVYANKGFTQSTSYLVDDICLPKDIFSLSLTMNSTSSNSGTQVMSTECNVHVAPINQNQYFYINSSSQTSNPLSCQSTCYNVDHLLLNVYLDSSYATGWNGVYYAVMPDNNQNTGANKGLGNVNPIVTGTMSEVSEETQQICIPLVSKCYTIQLFYPFNSVNNYSMILTDAYEINYPKPGSTSLSTEQCGYYMDLVDSTVSFCYAATDKYTQIYFAQPGSISGIGESSNDLTSYWSIASNKKRSYSTCGIKMTSVSGVNTLTYPPTRSPTASPSRSPTFTPTVSPSLSQSPTTTAKPSYQPNAGPTLSPSFIPTLSPSFSPTLKPSLRPSIAPSQFPTSSPTVHTDAPTFTPTLSPTYTPSFIPTISPTFSPTKIPTLSPTRQPTQFPTDTLSNKGEDFSLTSVFSQTLVNVQASDWQQTATTNNQYFIQTIHTLLPDIETTNIQINNIQPTSRRSLASTIATQSSSSLIITYTIFIPSILALGYNDADHMLNYVQSTLQGSLVSTQFITIFQQIVTSSDPSNTLFTTLQSPSNTFSVDSSASTPVSSSSSKGSNSSTTSIIAVVVVFGVLFLVIVGYFMWKRSKARSSRNYYSRQQPTNDFTNMFSDVVEMESLNQDKF